MKSLEEFGKQLLNIGVAIIVFAVIQPIISGELDLKTLVLAVISYAVVSFIGAIFIELGGKKDDNV